jgi:23S rRNA (uracil1939-C5)-methyltransferase
VTEFTVTIERIGARGDGVARHEGRAIFLPFTAPGDVAYVRRGRDGKAELIEIVSPGARQEPPCPHFGQCGGCSLQHLPDATYAEAKTNFVREALAHRGIDPAIVEPVRRVPPGTRRRARLAMTDGAIGFRQRGSHRIVDMKTCFVLHPKLVAVASALRALRLDGEASLTLADTGIDLTLDLARPPDLATLETLARFAEAQDLARLAWRVGEEAPAPVVQRRAVRLNFSGAAVDLPPDCFLQATEESETAMRDLVLAGIGEAKHVADLFCGVGTFGFALAANAKVHAVDGDKAAIAALQAAARRAGVAVEDEVRDLNMRPLLAEEFDRFDAVAFDPPYAGAAAQSRELARSTVKRIVAVSCNPASFARDARTLADGGYRLTRIVPVDQFVWSAEVELVAWFERKDV